MSGDAFTYSLHDFYGHRVLFSRKGAPLISVRMMERQKEVSVTSQGGLLVEVGEKGPSMTLPANATIKVLWLNGIGARLKRFLVLETLEGSSRLALDQVQERWASRGINIGFKTIGGVYGVRDTFLDNRAVLVVADDKKMNQKKAEQMGLKVWWHEEIVDLPKVEIAIDHPQYGLITIDNKNVSPVVRLTALQKKTITVKNVEHGIGYDFHGFDDRTLRGEVIVLPDKYGTLAVVNVVPEEVLVAGILPAEMFATAPMASLKAQAVTARGEIFAKIGKRHVTDPYLLCSEQHCQVYKGLTAEHPRTNKAARETRGQLAFYEGRLVDSVYSACCGGHTEANHHVWDQPPSKATVGQFDGPLLLSEQKEELSAFFPKGLLIQKPQHWNEKISLQKMNLETEKSVRAFLKLPREAAYCGRSTFNQKGDVWRWERNFSYERLNSLIGPLKIGSFVGIEVLNRGPGGRVKTLKISGTTGDVRIRRELPIRRFFNNLRSGLFVINRVTKPETGEKVIQFQGAGFGHGSGMCQQGAIGMAESGHDYREILWHYFNGATVKSVF